MRRAAKPHLLLLWSALLAATPGAFASTPLKCLSAPSFNFIPSVLPKSVRVGVETVHRSSNLILTQFIPMEAVGDFGGQFSTYLLDTNHKPETSPEPQLLISGDGTVERVFLGVDARPGTILSACVNELLDRAKKFRSDLPVNESIARFLTTEIEDFLEPVDQNSSMPFDEPSKTLVSNTQSAELDKLFVQARDLPVGHFPLQSSVFHPVVPLEEYLRLRKSYCLQKATLASLVLSAANIPHRLVAGSTGNDGHTWVELSGGRILDPTWKVLQQKTTQGALPGWVYFANSYRFEYHSFPMLQLQ